MQSTYKCEKGLVSIITPCYNGAEYVSVLLDSLMRQSYPKMELIFVDDGCTDNTFDIVKSYEKKLMKNHISLKYVNKENGGLSSAIDAGLKHVTGEFLIWPDSEDWLADNAIKHLVGFLNQHPDFSAVRGNAIYRKDNVEKEILRIAKPEDPKKNDLFLNYILEEDIYCFAGVIMIRTEVFFENNKGRDIYVNRAGQNWQMILPVAYHHKIGYIDKDIYNVWVRCNSLSGGKETPQDVIHKWKRHKKIIMVTITKIVDDKCEQRKYLKIVKNKYKTRIREFKKYAKEHPEDFI